MINKILCVWIILVAASAPAFSGPEHDPKVMPDTYEIVAQNLSFQDQIDFGDGSKRWDTIVLWGRTMNPGNIGTGMQYSWKYGDNTPDSPWTSISAFNRNFPYSASNQYLYSDQHVYPPNNSATPKTYTASMRIRNSSFPLVYVSTNTVQVTVVNIGLLSTDSDKRNYMQAIANGRALTTLYLTQSRTDGSWPGLYLGKNLPMLETAYALIAYLKNRHAIDDFNGLDDIFYDTVVSGFNYLFKNATISSAVDNPATGDSDMPATQPSYGGNGDLKKILFALNTSVPGFSMVEQGACMQALALYRSSATIAAGYTVSVGASATSMYLEDVVKDAVDYAAYAQNNGNGSGLNGWNGFGWSYGPRYAGTNWYDDGTGKYFGTHLDYTEPMILGLILIEKNWSIKARSFVRDRLLHLVRTMQDQKGSNITDPDTLDSDGGAVLSCVHGECSNYTTVNPPQSSFDLNYTDAPTPLSTVSLLLTLYYLSMDTTNTAACNCGAADCNAITTDFQLTQHSPGDCTGSCLRVMGAINCLGRNIDPGTYQLLMYRVGITPPSSVPFQQYYAASQAFRLYNYVQGGINDGILNGNGDAYIVGSLPTLYGPGGIQHTWEKEFTTNALNTMTEYASGDWKWHWYCPYDQDGAIAQSWGVLLLSNVTNTTAQFIKTENKLPRILREARNSKGQEMVPFSQEPRFLRDWFVQ